MMIERNPRSSLVGLYSLRLKIIEQGHEAKPVRHLGK
jgi:hypothetical protein